MIAAGALCFGLVLGWAAGFIGWSPDGLAVRVLAAAALVITLFALGSAALAAGLAGAAIGTLAHEAFLAALRHQVLGQLR